MAFRRRADDGPLIVVFWSSHQLIKIVVKVGPLYGSAHVSFIISVYVCVCVCVSRGQLLPVCMLSTIWHISVCYVASCFSSKNCFYSCYCMTYWHNQRHGLLLTGWNEWCSMLRKWLIAFFLHLSYIRWNTLTCCNPASIQCRATIGPPAKRHLNGVSLAGRLWPAFRCLLGSSERQVIHSTKCKKLLFGKIKSIKASWLYERVILSKQLFLTIVIKCALHKSKFLLY